MKYLLDTDCCIFLMRGEPNVVEHAKQISPDDIAVSAITHYELSYGVLRCMKAHREREKAKVTRLMDVVHQIPFTQDTAAIAAELRYELEKKGQTIGPMDVMIAATAIEARLILVTGNEKEFSRINHLQIESWR